MSKEVIIKELKTLVKKENLSIDDMIDIMSFASSWELAMFKKSIIKILKEWKRSFKKKTA